MPQSRVLSPRSGIVALCTLVLAGLAGCSSPVAVPDVVGLRLDDAHDALEEAGFEEFEDVDHFEDRSILWDSNWVVLEQNPSTDGEQDTDTTVTLRVGHISEDRDRLPDLLPSDSPVLAEIQEAIAEDAQEAAQERAEEEAERAEERAEEEAEEAARQALVVDYVNALDPVTRLAQTDLPVLAAIAAEARAGSSSGTQILVDVVDATTALDSYASALLLVAPGSDTGVEDAHQQLEDAITTFDQAARTLLSVTGPASTESLDRFDVVYAQAVQSWNEALSEIYSSTGVAAPLIS